MTLFVDNFRNAVKAPTLEIQGQPRGYVPANATVKGAQQTANFSPDALGFLVDEYNSTSDWNTKTAIVNAMMEKYPNPDRSLKKWITNLDKKTQEGAQQSRVLSWAMDEYNKTPDIDKKEQIVNYLMETYPNPSKWLRSKIMKLDDMTRTLRKYQDEINNGGSINDLGDYR